ncbi:MAG TPA: BREX system P-loop protein BrxC [Bryobacteraceae bacterium]|nr:BREX system P-loop protein BrxC [Bryobacteraceae bacterium]
MKLYELFDRDLRTARLANNGQARITGTEDAQATAELRAELEVFVCEGQFAHATELILDRYLGNLQHTKQDAAWVSGFFGSGKSHLLKMLAHLWVNTEFSDGSTARNLVVRGLPEEIEAHLRELDTQVQRTQLPAVAAAGTLLGGSDRVRETVLAIILRGTGWPQQYPQAKFCFWLRDRGWLDTVRREVEGVGRDWLKELNNLYVSPHIRRSLFKLDPDLASDEKEISKVLRVQFPPLLTDITTAEFVEAATEALKVQGQIPITLVVLDEVQQYIHEAADRAAVITEVSEALQTQFDSRIMLVGAGQSALSGGTDALMWLRDRFKISIELADADVETVIRKVLLHKKPSTEKAIEKVLETNSGEVARHLQGTRIGEKPEDRQVRVADYPLLPTRRRFWEACFQAADAAGTNSQLRSQLRILHDALSEVALEELGSVLPASGLFTALAPALVNTGVLLNEINTRIQKLDDGTKEGALARDLCGLVFLIGKLPRETGVDLGVRADATTLADLMVRDIRADSGPFRKKVEDKLTALAGDGTLMQVGSEFRLQTTEGAEWDRAFREKQSSIRQNEVEIAGIRDHLLGHSVQEIVTSTKLVQGDAKIRRTLALHTGSDQPRGGGDHVTVWLRDGWSAAEKDVLAQARQMGQEESCLHLYLAKKNSDDLRARIIDAAAAQQVLDQRGTPSTPEGLEAREGMESRLRAAEDARDAIVREIVRAAKLFQGGGTEVFGDKPDEKLATGAKGSLARLFPRFDEGDHGAWPVAVKRAREGSDEPLKIVGWDQATEDHPVAKEVLRAVGAGRKGSEVQKELKAAPYGWPQDAIDAALIALHRSGHLRATKNGQAIAAGALDQAGVKAADFRPEKVRLTVQQRIKLRGLYEKAGVAAKSGEEESKAGLFLEALALLAGRAGGVAPLPAPPDTQLLHDLRQLAGTEQLDAFLKNESELRTRLEEWGDLGGRGAQRVPVWDRAQVFRGQAAGLECLGEVAPELDALVTQRSLLADPDHVTPLCAKLAAGLREALKERHGALAGAVTQAKAQLASDPTWQKLDPAAQADVASTVGLTSPPALDVGSDEKLQSALSARSLSAWQAEVDAIPARVAQALDLAAARLQKENPEDVTTAVSIRKGTLADAAAVTAWIEEHTRKLTVAVAKGPVIVK